MDRGVDTNALVYAHVPDSADHARVGAFLSAELRTRTLVLTSGVLGEFLHVVTDRRRVQGAPSMEQAAATVRGYLRRENVACLETDEECVLRALDLIESHGLGRRRVADTVLAATLIRHGVRELITCDPGDFAIFEGLTVVDPREG